MTGVGQVLVGGGAGKEENPCTFLEALNSAASGTGRDSSVVSGLLTSRGKENFWLFCQMNMANSCPDMFGNFSAFEAVSRLFNVKFHLLLSGAFITS